MPRGKPGVWEHGTESGYRAGGCRLDCCREAHRAYNAARNAKRDRPKDLPQLPGSARTTTRRTRHAKGQTLEELLDEW